MQTNRTKLIVVISLSIVLCALSCFGFAQIAKFGSEGRAPIKTLDVTIHAGQREELFAKLRRFADDHAFKINIRDIEVMTGPSGKGFLVEMLRDDVYINAIGNASAPITISVNFKNTDSGHPAQNEVIDELCIDLEESLRNVTDLKITQPCVGRRE
jgi:hypothetical protein